MKVIESQTESGRVIRIQVADDVPPSVTPRTRGGALTRGKPNEIVKQLTEVGDSIADVCNTLQAQIQKTLDQSKPSELTLAFSVTLSGEAGIPLVTRGSAEGTFQVTARWDFSKEA